MRRSAERAPRFDRAAVVSRAMMDAHRSIEERLERCTL
jgi:hypothetical protein